MIRIDIRLQVSGLIQVNGVQFSVVFVRRVVKIVVANLILVLVGVVRRSVCIVVSAPGAYGQNSIILEGWNLVVVGGEVGFVVAPNP